MTLPNNVNEVVLIKPPASILTFSVSMMSNWNLLWIWNGNKTFLQELHVHHFIKAYPIFI